jgi:hypothetical protein
MRPNKEEIVISGKWIVEGKKITPDETCERINWLKTNYLQKIATDVSGWDVLYLDPGDGRFWELTYVNSEMHGGGPPVLKNILSEEAKHKYGI